MQRTYPFNLRIFRIIFMMILYVRTRRKKRLKGSAYINESNDKMHTSVKQKAKRIGIHQRV